MTWRRIALGLARLRSLLDRAVCAVVPNARVRSAARRIVTGIVLVGLAAAGPDGCTADVQRLDDGLQLFRYDPAHFSDHETWIPLLAPGEPGPLEVERGQTVRFVMKVGPRSDWAKGVPPNKVLLNDVTGTEDAEPIGSGTPPAGVDATFDRSAQYFGVFGRYEVYVATLAVGRDAELGPIHLRSRWFETEYAEVRYAIHTFNVREGPNAPKVGAAVPDTATRGEETVSVDVELAATNVDHTVSVRAGNPSISVTATWDEAAGKVRATLQIPPNTRTGATYLVVESGPADAAGKRNRSRNVPFTVSAGPATPVIVSFFPNYAEVGRTASFLVGGTDFTPHTLLFREGVEVGAMDVRDSHSFTTSLQVAPGASPTHLDFTVLALGGPSDPALPGRVRYFVAPGPPLPRITRIDPVGVVTNTTVQIRVEGESLASGGALEVLTVGSDALGSAPSARVLPGTASHDDFAVVEFVLPPHAPALALGPSGTMHLALRNADGFVSNAEPVFVRPRNPAPHPVILSAKVGEIVRGGPDVVETIRGIRLHEVMQVLLESGGVERVGDFVPDPTGNSITVTLRAEDGAPLTGDAVTNLVVETLTGGRSNPLSYSVVAPACQDGLLRTGIELTMTHPDGSEASFGQAASFEPRDVEEDLGITNVYLTGPGSFRVELPAKTGDLHVGSVTPTAVEYFDSAHMYWYSTSDVRIVAEDDDRLVVCVDVELIPGYGQPGKVTVKGYIGVNRR